MLSIYQDFGLLLSQISKYYFYDQNTILIQGQTSTMIKTPASILREKFMTTKSIAPNDNDIQYIEKLKSLGLDYHSSLQPSFFELQNGLKYPGMSAKKFIGPKQVLVKVPEKLILSSIKALGEPALVQVFGQPFYQEQNTWEDRVLITYLLYLYNSEAKDNIFYDMLEHMSKDIDLCCFWNSQELDLFKDKTVKSAALADLQSFETQWSSFEEVKNKYQVLKGQKITKENYKWIYVHVSSRCFGKYIDYTSFVPFCQFFNHHSCSVNYQIYPDSQQKRQPKQQNQEDDEISSNQTNDSQDYLDEEQYAYDKIQPVSYSWGFKECFDLDKKERRIINARAQSLFTKAEEQIDWKDSSILFVGKVYENIKLIESQYISGRIKFKQTQQKLSKIQQVIEKYVHYIKAFYKTIKPKSFKYNATTSNEEQKPKYIRPNPLEYIPSFQQFFLKTDKLDKFSQNNQVYFCYGRNSNRSLLLRYGFAIQGNKYEHVWMSYDLSACLKYLPDILPKIQKKGLSIKRKFKIKYTQLNMDLIVFHRLVNWNFYGIRSLDEIFYVMNIQKQLQILEEMRQSLEQQIGLYEGETDLTDKNIGYHQYFARVYHIEKINILKNQIMLLTKLETILKKIDKQQTIESATQDLSSTEKYVLKNYIDSIVV